MTDIPALRAAFELPGDRAYLNTAFLGPMPTAAVEAGRAALDAKSHPWTITTESFFEPVESLRSAVASLLGGDADGVANVPSVSYGIATAAANLVVPADSTIVLMA